MGELEFEAFCTTQLGTALEQYRGFVEAYGPAVEGRRLVPRSARRGVARLVSPEDWSRQGQL